MTYSELILSHSPSNYWKLNESSGLVAVDAVGAKDGTISGGVTLNQPGALADGTTAMSFDGTTGVVTCAALTVGALATHSLEYWVKIAQSAELYGAPFAPRNQTGLGGCWTTIHSHAASNGHARLTYRGLADIDTPTVITYGVWHHVVWTFGAGTATGYVDGAVAVTTPVAYTDPTTGPLVIGFNANGLITPSLPLAVDEVALYPRALTPTEISDHYAARLTTAVPSAGCDHTTVWSKHLATLSAPTVESERAYLATLYGVPGASDFSTLVSRWLQAINCGATSLEATLTPETVQTGTASAASADTLTLTFPGATGNGRGLVVGVISSSSSALPAGACSDNKGNAYTRILSQAGTGSSLAVYLCPIGVGGPVHSITLAPALGAISLLATAIEVRGVGAGLALDASGSTTGSSATPAATSSAVTTQGLISLALMALDTQQSTLTVATSDGQSPGWIEQAEALG